MENRAIYLRVLDLVRCGKEIPEYSKHSHSSSLLRLRLGVLEDDIYFDANLTYLKAWATLSSHPNIDVMAAFGNLSKIFDKVLNTRKYIHSESKEDAELLKLVEQYKKTIGKDDKNA